MTASSAGDTLLPELNLKAAGNEMEAAWNRKTCFPVVSLSFAALNQDNKFNVHQIEQLGSLSSSACMYFWAIKAGYQLYWLVEPADLITKA